MSAGWAHAALLTGALVFSGYNLVISRCLSSNEISPLAFSLARELVSIVVMYGAASLLERPLRWPSGSHQLFRFGVLGCLLAAFQLCFTVGIALTDAMTAAVFQCIQPTTAALLSTLTCSERLLPSKVAAALFAGAGVALIELNPATRAAPDASHDSGIGSGSEASPAYFTRTAGCVLLFLQGVGIASYCLVQKTLVCEPSAAHTPPNLHAELYEHDSDAPFLAADAAAPSRRMHLPNSQRPPVREGGYAALTATAHAYCASTGVLVLAAVIDTALHFESPPPLSRAQLAAFVSTPLPSIALLYAVFLASLVGYSLGTWANKRLDASTVVLYNAVQPPLTAILGFVAGVRERQFGAYEASGTTLVMLAVIISTRAQSGISDPRCPERRERRAAREEEDREHSL